MVIRYAFLQGGSGRYGLLAIVKRCFVILMVVVHLNVLEAICDEKPPLEVVAGKVSPYSVTFQDTSLRGVVKTPVVIPMEISPYPTPSGQFYSILADILQKPPGAEVITRSGYKQLEIIGDRKGLYRFRVKINVLQKSSCGGIDAKEFGTQEISIHLD
ncbi:MAG: hypothetical protein HOD92_23025 [Deltaproteobacteria bacterium]|jgi:hypothetical protein|nr:hypothetical protein [Deltaproteobacteria bacterium]